MFLGTFCGVKMNGARLWVTIAAVQALVLMAGCAKPHRRSMASQQTLPLSKGGWRPVVGSSGLVFGYGTAPLHAPSYKIPVPVLDTFASSARPLSTRDATKLTSIAQSYRPTTIRAIPAGGSIPAASQPINTYLNPFALNSNGISHYKYIQNFPSDSVLIRNPHNPFAARPVFQKHQKFKQQYPMQQLTNVQPIQFGQPSKPLDSYGKPSEAYARPEKKPAQSADIETFKPEVFKLPDTDTAPQSVTQQVKTAQQSMVTPKVPVNGHFPQFAYQDSLLPPNILGTFGSFGLHTMKRDPLFPAKTTYYPPQTTKQTIFNSFSFPTFKTTPSVFISSTPKLQTTANQIHFGTNWNVPTQPPKPAAPEKIDPNTSKGSFKASPQDPFINKYNVNYKVSTYKPTVQTTTYSYSNFHEYPQQQQYQYEQQHHHQQQQQPHHQHHRQQQKQQQKQQQQQYQQEQYDHQQQQKQHKQQQQQQQRQQQQQQYQQEQYDHQQQKQHQQQQHQQQQQQYQQEQYHHQQQQQQQQQQYQQDQYHHQQQQEIQSNYYNQQEAPVKKKNKIHDSQAQLTNQENSQQYVNPPKAAGLEATQNSVPFRATYEVTETYDDGITHSQAWSSTPDSQKTTEEVVTQQEYDNTYGRPPTPLSDLPEEYAIVTEGEKGYDNSLSYDSQVETQSRRPLGDDFEPIGKHKLKDYYYRVSTPTYEDHSTRRTKKPTESSKISATPEVTTYLNKDNDLLVEPLPTLPPNQHFKRPSSTEAPIEKDRVRKRNKLRRRRPPLANINRESSTRRYSSTTESNNESHTIRPRVRPSQAKQQLTTPTTSTDLSTSAVPTVSPTSPTIVKKKLVHRRPYTTTTTEKSETTTTKEYDSNKESPIMKISASSRSHLPKLSLPTFDYRTSEIPDYSHKQDEKDTPTSDIAVSISDSLKTTTKTETSGPSKNFSFHRDAKPIEAKLEPVREHTTDSIKDVEINDITTTSRTETTSSSGKISRPRMKYNRPNFSVKDYRNRLSSTTSTTEKPAETNAPRIRFPQRRIPVSDNDTTTERKKFTPKDPKHKSNDSEINEETDKEIHSIRPNRNKQTVETTESTTHKISSRIRNGSRRPRPTEADQTTENPVPTTERKRILRKKIKDSEHGESVQDINVTETTSGTDTTSERTRSESAIMKIADKKHQDHLEHSKRVSDLTLAASKDYNTPGMFKTVSASSRRIPNYFTIATDDPILPIEAFFPQINQKKES